MIHVARWIAANWWRLLHEPTPESAALTFSWRMAHDLAAAGGGFDWPPIRVESDGERVRFRKYHADQHAIASVEHLVGTPVECAVDDADRLLGSIVDRVLARCHARGVVDDELQTLWSIVREEACSPAQRRLRRIEALLGLDPDQQPESDVYEQLHAIGWVGATTAEEVCAAASAANLRAWIPELARLRHDTVAHGPGAFGPPLGAQPERALPAWERGRAIALAMRSAFGWGNGPVATSALADALSVSPAALDPRRRHSSELPLSMAVFKRGDALHLAFPLRKRDTGIRFDAARLLADLCANGASEPAVAAADTKTARQKLQRAAAQELLCPTEAMRERLDLPRPSDADIEDMAGDFGVSPLLIRTALVNQGMVDRDYLDPGY